MAVSAIPLSDGQLELEGLPDVVFDTVSEIAEKPVFGSPYFNPNTGRSSTLPGQTEYSDITVETLLDAALKTRVNAFIKTWRQNRTGITATHIIGDVITHLTGVRFAGISYGQINKLSNDASKLRIIISYEGIRDGN